MSEPDWDGRTAVVTGGGSGIGRAIATKLAEAGAKVALIGRRIEPLEEVAEDIAGRGGRAYPIQADVSEWGSVEQAARKVKAVGSRVDILVNNAGTARPGTFVDLPPSEIDTLIDTNLKGVIYSTKALLTDLIDSKGDIVNVSSLAGVTGFAEWSVYSAAKHGVVGFGGSLARELAETGVRVLTVCPGATDTDLWSEELPYRGPATRMLDPDEVATVIMRMLSMPRHVTFKDVVILPSGEWT